MDPDASQGEETAAMLTVAAALYESQDNYSPRQARDQAVRVYKQMLGEVDL